MKYETKALEALVNTAVTGALFIWLELGKTLIKSGREG